ncbi:MAG: protein kinase [Planctomycetes bacterium]|nr:protein kinase [Planctomycetota bacterium]
MYEDFSPDRILGQLAVRKRVVTPDQMAECLAEQEALAKAGATPPPLGALLIKKGYLSSKALERLLAAKDETFADGVDPRERKIDARFGKRLVAHGLTTEEQVRGALEAQDRLRRHGIPLRLGEILVSRGILTETQVRDALRLQDKTVVLCPVCAKAYNARGYRPGKKLKCPTCGGPLVLPAVGGSIRVIGSEPSLAPVGPPARGGSRPAAGAEQEHPPAPTAPGATEPEEADAPAPRRAGAADDDLGDAPGAEAGESDEAVGTEAPPELAGEPFGRYRLLGIIGHGGAGIVHKAWDTELKRIVAIKFLRPDTVGSERAVERFLREARAAARLRHPNLVAVHDVGTFDARHYFTMDYIEGENLGARKNALPPRRFLEVLLEVAHALHVAHKAGMVHRDVKPANILLDAADRPYVTDFGLAREVQDASGDGTASGAILGTPKYMSPEQAEGHTDAVSARSDVWSLGVILYEHLAGRPPFEGASLVEILIAVIHTEPPPPSRKAAAGARIHPDLETMCMKCLEREPTRRYATAGEFAADLSRFLQGEAIQARPTSLLERVGRRASRQTAMLLPTALAIFLAVLLGAFALAHRASQRAQVEQALRQARELMANGRAQKAVLFYNTVLELDPGHAAARDEKKAAEAAIEQDQQGGKPEGK